jgi:hypothetical protein
MVLEKERNEERKRNNDNPYGTGERKIGSGNKKKKTGKKCRNRISGLNHGKSSRTLKRAEKTLGEGLNVDGELDEEKRLDKEQGTGTNRIIRRKKLEDNENGKSKKNRTEKDMLKVKPAKKRSREETSAEYKRGMEEKEERKGSLGMAGSGNMGYHECPAHHKGETVEETYDPYHEGTAQLMGINSDRFVEPRLFRYTRLALYVFHLPILAQ